MQTAYFSTLLYLFILVIIQGVFFAEDPKFFLTLFCNIHRSPKNTISWLVTSYSSVRDIFEALEKTWIDNGWMKEWNEWSNLK